MKRIDIKEIDFAKSYEGYLWYSDKSTPSMLGKDKKISMDSFTNLPFIVEGYLYDSESQTSLKIRHVDGEYLIHQALLGGYSRKEFSEKSFVTQKIDGKAIFIKAVQHWEETIDPLCEDMVVLKPSWIAFTGFDHQTKTHQS